MRARAASLLLFVLLSSACSEPQPERPPNLLLISLDTLRVDHVGSYGYSRDTTPFLDQIAAGGTRFETALVNTFGTPPAHATMLSSLYQESHRVSWGESGDHRVPERLPILPDLLRSAGYRTVAVTGGGFLSGDYGYTGRFDVLEDQPRRVDQQRQALREALRETSDDGRPTFVFFHTYEIHSPYDPPEEYRGMFVDGQSDFDPTSANLLEHWENASVLGDETIDFLRARYDEGIRYTDDVLRRLFADLEEIGFLDRAVVIVTSDHGELFGENNHLLHPGVLLDELLRVPLILYGTGVPAGAVSEALVSHVDIAPTLLEAAGVEPPEHAAGRSLIGVDETETGRELVFTQFHGRLYSVRDQRWKLIYSPPRRIELYDWRADPNNATDLAADEPDTARQLMRQLLAWRDACPELELGADREAFTERPDLREQLRALGYLQ